jgi:hypothetical protein
LGQKNNDDARTGIVNHSVNGEFAYREGGWKIVFKMPKEKLEASRGKPAVVELFNLNDDIAEKHDVATEHPEIVERLSGKLRSVVDNGRSRPGPIEKNDAKVSFDVISTERWAPALD